MTDPRAEAALELARRRLVYWAKLRDPGYRVDGFHAHLGAHLDRVIRGETHRLLVQAAPQHGKSRLVAELCSAWLGHHPDGPIITTSYSASLAVRNSRMVRAAVRSQEFRSVFGPLHLDPERSASNDWGLADHGGGMVAAGVGGPITGHGALLGVIDDPHKNAEEAYSPVYRAKVWEWYESTFLTRIWEGGRVVLIQTRWHPDDLAGRILEREGDRWTVLNYPALNEDDLGSLPEGKRPRGWRPDSLSRKLGEALAPSRFSAGHLARVRDSLHPIVWSALYQQRPSTIEGGIIKVDRLEVVDDPPPTARCVRFWDMASTPEGGGHDPDYTAGVLMGVTADGHYVIRHIVHGRFSPAEAERRVVETARMDGQGVNVYMEQEPGSSGVAMVDHYRRLLAGWSFWPERATGPQVLRVMPLAAQVEGRRVLIARGPWVHGFIEEARSYRGDGATHDDRVVAAAGAFSKLAGSQGLVAKVEPDNTRGDFLEDTWDDLQTGSGGWLALRASRW